MSEHFLRLTEAPLERGLPLEERVRRHRLRFVTPIRQPAVLISQVQRSGGTLMSQLLDGHSALYVHPSELHIGRPYKYFWPDLSASMEADDLFANLREKVSENLADTGYQKPGVADRSENPDNEHGILPFMFSPEFQRQIFLKLLRAWKPLSQRDILDSYITSYFNAWIDYQGLYRDPGSVIYWSAFVPRLSGDAPSVRRFLADYPDGKLIVIVRDPVSWFASAHRHSTDYNAAAASAALWRENYESILANARMASRTFLFVSFENLVADVEAEMRRVCQFLGLGFEPCLLSPTFNGLPIKSDSSFAAKFGVDRSAANRRDRVSNEEAAAITAITADVYAELCALTKSRPV